MVPFLLDRIGSSYQQGSVGFICRQQGGIHGLHTGGAGEGAHQPGVDAVQVVDVKARQEPNGITIFKIHHADHTPEEERSSVSANNIMQKNSFL